MVNKRTTRTKGPNSSEAPPSSERSPSSKRHWSKKGSWPVWPWVLVGLALVLIGGRIFAQDDKKSRVAKSSGGSGKKQGGTKSATETSLSLLLELQEMTNEAEDLRLQQLLDGPAARQMHRRLDEIELELSGLGEEMSHSVRSIISIIRGTLGHLAKEAGVDDADLTGSKNAYTYADAEYWDAYYNKTGKDELYDWYGSWDTPVQGVVGKDGDQQPAVSTLGDLLKPFLDRTFQILMLGCGNSDMSEKMYGAGFEDITNVDISEQLLANLRSRLSATMPRMKWLHMNASALTFEESSFDVVLDKGTLDALELDRPLMLAAASESYRVLKPGGVFLSVTFRAAAKRVDDELRGVANWHTCQSWAFDRPERVEKGSEYYLHACIRPSLAS